MHDVAMISIVYRKYKLIEAKLSGGEGAGLLHQCADLGIQYFLDEIDSARCRMRALQNAHAASIKSTTAKVRECYPRKVESCMI